MDRISKKQRSENMSHIRGKDTSLEKKVRSYLFAQGFRFRKNVRSLPGTPDIVLQKYKTVIFVNGCFWHHHKNCKLAYNPKSNVKFWNDKFNRNIINDKKNSRELKKLGYKVITVWECKLKTNFMSEMYRISNTIKS